MSISSDISYLEGKIKNFVKIILKEFGDKFSLEHRKYLNRLLENEHNAVMQSKSINCYCFNGKIFYPLDYYNIVNQLKSSDKRFGTEPGKIFVNDENKIVNDNNYFTFFQYAIVAGLTPREIFKAFTLHETMHLCGAAGYELLSEAFTELKTRELALKYGVDAACCNYSDEVKIAMELQEIFGKDLCDCLTFVPNDMKVSFLKRVSKLEFATLYERINNELNFQMIKYQKERNGVTGLNGIEKVLLLYSKKDYSKVYKLLDNFKSMEDNFSL